jgi:AcrR family transcriptional regulator
MSSELPPSTREPGRRGKQGETRARLIQAAIEIVRSEGLTALTTSRITRAAGIAQPGFYAHFKNTDELVRTAISQVLEDMREKITEVRRRTFERFRHIEGLANLEATRAVYQETLDVFLSDPSFAELMLRYRRDPSLLGGYMREAMENVREEITDDMWRICKLVGFTEDKRDVVNFWAEQIVALYFAAAEALLDKRQEDRAKLVEALALSSFAIMRANLRAAGLTGQVVQEAARKSRARDDKPNASPDKTVTRPRS